MDNIVFNRLLNEIIIIGCHLAGTEIAWLSVERGICVMNSEIRSIFLPLLL